jgi:hypothetical protein
MIYLGVDIYESLLIANIHTYIYILYNALYIYNDSLTDIDFLNKNELLSRKKSLKITTGKLHAVACAYRISNNLKSMHDTHHLIEKHKAEIKECEYLIDLADKIPTINNGI